ncbi:MAG: hypothetical protein J4G09_15625 [Proteobacteria bacterium]|nr:hypothetical protein [Pseudomonadota bacterium]
MLFETPKRAVDSAQNHIPAGEFGTPAQGHGQVLDLRFLVGQEALGIDRVGVAAPKESEDAVESVPIRAAGAAFALGPATEGVEFAGIPQRQLGVEEQRQVVVVGRAVGNGLVPVRVE